MYVKSLWRYPVKSLRGEQLTSAELTDDGVAGDRLVHIRNFRGPLTGRSRSQLLTIPAATGPDGRPLIAGHAWDSPEAAAFVRGRGGADAEPAAYDGPERFDILNLLVATDSAVAELGEDVRRLRPNVLIGDVPAGAERTWEGRALAVGDALIGIRDLRGRCVVTTIDPDTGAQDVAVLRRIRDEFGGRLALNCWVITPATIRVGDPVTVVDTDAEPEHLGGWIVGAPYRGGRAAAGR
jgi:MOSC domain-containing protein